MILLSKILILIAGYEWKHSVGVHHLVFMSHKQSISFDFNKETINNTKQQI